VALTIAGSDSGGGAGIQADLKAFAAAGVHGASVITCLTAQNPARVIGLQPVPPRFVLRQLEAVFAEIPPAAAKTGMLHSAGVIHAVARWWRRHRQVPLVIDPVLVSTSGTRLLAPSAVRVLVKELFPLATLITPNLPEAEALLGVPVRSEQQMEAWVRVAWERWGRAVLLKGGHLPHADAAVDFLHDGRRVHRIVGPLVHGVATHGTGCTYSALIASQLALGKSLVRSVSISKKLMTQAIRRSVRIGSHWALNPSRAQRRGASIR
jgi:hydroxymethylpyrimidine/phosphomethylpyrimidine kinase